MERQEQAWQSSYGCKILAKAEELGYKKTAPSTNDDGSSHNIGILIAERSMNANATYMSLQQPLITNLTQLNYYGITEIISDETEHLLIISELVSDNSCRSVLSVSSTECVVNVNLSV